MFYLLLLGTGLLKVHTVIVLATALQDSSHLWCLALAQKGMNLEIITLLKIIQSELPAYYQAGCNVSSLGMKGIDTISSHDNCPSRVVAVVLYVCCF